MGSGEEVQGTVPPRKCWALGGKCVGGDLVG